jgi:hypothetical protein
LLCWSLSVMLLQLAALLQQQYCFTVRYGHGHLLYSKQYLLWN